MWRFSGRMWQNKLQVKKYFRVRELLIRLNRFFHVGKSRNRSNRFFAIFCNLLRFNAIYCDFSSEIKLDTGKRLKRTVKIDSLHGFPCRYSRKFKIDRVENYRMTRHYAGRMTDFSEKNRAIILERFFGRGISGEALLPLQLCSH